jgi:hypothetical protein
VVPPIIVLVNPNSPADNPEITDFYAVNTSEGQGIIIFENEEKLEEVRAAAQEWAKADGLLAASMNLYAATPAEAVELLVQMSPHLRQMTFLSDDDPFVDQMLQHIRQMRGTP